MTLLFIFILLISALFSYWLRPSQLVIAFPHTRELYFLQNQSRVPTRIPDIVDVCTARGALHIVGGNGTIYRGDDASILHVVPIRLEWCTVKHDVLYVGSDEGIYKLPGNFRQTWQLPPGARYVDWHPDEWIIRNESFRYFPSNERKIIYLSPTGYVVEHMVEDGRAISSQYVGQGARGIAFIG